MANIVLRLSSGSAVSDSIDDPRKSLGGKMALTAAGGSNVNPVINPNTASLNNIWDDITKSENFNGTKDYRCIYISNASVGGSSASFLNASLYKSNTTYATYRFGKAAAKNQYSPTTVNENTPPAGVTFAEYTKSNKMALGDLNPGDYIYVWIERTASNVVGAGTTTESMDLILEGAE